MPWFNVAVTWRLARIRLVRYRGSQSGGGDQRWQEDVRGEDLTKKIRKKSGFLEKSPWKPRDFPISKCGGFPGETGDVGGKPEKFPKYDGVLEMFP